MKRVLANVIVWGLFGTVAMILVAGCASVRITAPLCLINCADSRVEVGR